jgi:Protein of unknown function (DUF1064)
MMDLDLAHLRARALAWQAEGVYQDPETVALLNAAAPASKGKRKYNNQPTPTDAGMADSKAEAERWGELRLLERAGEIAALRFHPRYKLPGGVVFEADSDYYEGGCLIVEDVKGGKATQTAAFKMKWRQMAECYPDAVLRIVER